MRIISDIFAYTSGTCPSSIRSRFPATTCRSGRDGRSRAFIADGIEATPGQAWRPAGHRPLCTTLVLLLCDRMNFFWRSRSSCRAADLVCLDSRNSRRAMRDPWRCARIADLGFLAGPAQQHHAGSTWRQDTGPCIPIPSMRPWLANRSFGAHCPIPARLQHDPVRAGSSIRGAARL